MSDRIFIGVAWPYANGSLHLGHLAGCYLPADIFARYHRLTGSQVLMVSGSDQHGTPVTLRAEQEGVSPKEVGERFHNEFLKCWEQMDISWDTYTSTGTSVHSEVVHDIFLSLLEKGYIAEDTMSLPYCTTDKRFLPDRYVEGVCPHCKYISARGDQCDGCGKTMNPRDLINALCRICGTSPETRESQHFFLRLDASQPALQDWVNKQVHWRPNALNTTRGWLKEGLRPRAITRDISWGVSIPLDGYEDKRIYVWFEAVIGYLSASKEWSNKMGNPDAWRDFWQDPATKTYYFIGKDNIPFHTIIWPAMLLGYGEARQEPYNLPYDVPANEFLTLEGQQFSTSRNWAVWLPDYLARYDADPLRYCLAANMPESSDSDFSWGEFLRRNNDELVATLGNLVHRVLTFTYRNFNGKVPEPGTLDDHDIDLLDKKSLFALEEAAQHLRRCNFRLALTCLMGLAQSTNRYLDMCAPWKTLSADPVRTGTTLWVALSVMSALKTLMYPFMPTSAQKLHALLGFEGRLETDGWQMAELPHGQLLEEPKPLFVKLDEKTVMAEIERMGQHRGEVEHS